MENIWEIIESPPSWVILLVICFAVSITIREILKVIGKKKVDVIAVLEISVMILLMTLVLHSYFAGSVGTETNGYRKFMSLFLICIFCSGALYIFYRVLFMILRKFFPNE